MKNCLATQWRDVQKDIDLLISGILCLKCKNSKPNAKEGVQYSVPRNQYYYVG